LSGSTLYGTTSQGGAYGSGTVFSIPVAGGPVTTLVSFHDTNGARPQAGLILSGSTLYGTTYGGGAYGDGTVFSLPVGGGAVTTLATFNDSTGGPNGGLILSGSTLYGTMYGYPGFGTVFSVPLGGGAVTTVATFNGGNGANPAAGLISSGSTLYGTTSGGASYFQSTVFSLNLGIPLNIQLKGASVVLSWNDPNSAFSLQSAPTMMGQFTNIPGATSPYTNGSTGAQQFFRLIGN
jgi:uncharacterized repeat protein (TIGR03803 family)